MLGDYHIGGLDNCYIGSIVSAQSSGSQRRAPDLLFDIAEACGKNRSDASLAFIEKMCSAEWLESIQDLKDVSDSRWEDFRVQYGIPVKFLDLLQMRLTTLAGEEQKSLKTKHLTADGLSSAHPASPKAVAEKHVSLKVPTVQGTAIDPSWPALHLDATRINAVHHRGFIFPSGELFAPNAVHPLLDAQVAEGIRPKVGKKDSLSCMRCGSLFGWRRFRRRHNCNLCGLLVCSRCSPTCMIVPTTGQSRPVRVCNACRQDDEKHKARDQRRREDMTARLFEAAADGRDDIVAKALAAGADVNARRVRGDLAGVQTGGSFDGLTETSLVVAAGGGHLGSVKLLLKARANPACSDDGESALRNAASIGSMEICAELIEHGAPTPSRSQIQEAAGSGHAKATAWLIENAGAHVQASLQQEMAMAMIHKAPQVEGILRGAIPIRDVAAALQGQSLIASVPRCQEAVALALLVTASTVSALATVQMLVEVFEVNVNEAFDATGIPLLFMSILRGDSGVLLTKLLLGLRAATESKYQNATALQFAVDLRPCNAEVVAALLDHKADFEARRLHDARGPLAIAASRGECEAASLLLDAKADVNSLHTVDEHGALRDAAAEGTVAVCKLLLAAKASVDQNNKENLRPLHAAVKFNQTDAVRVLLEASADPNDVSNSLGLSSLHLAIAEGHADCVVVLSERSARLDVTTQDGEDAIAFANKHAQKSNPDVVTETQTSVLEILVARKKVLIEALQDAAAQDDVLACQKALGGGIDPNVIDVGGFSAMSRAAAGGSVNVLKVLLEAGAHRPTSNLVLEAASHGHAEAVAWLLSNAEPSAQASLQQELARAILNETQSVKGLLEGTIPVSNVGSLMKESSLVASVPRCSPSSALVLLEASVLMGALDTAQMLVEHFRADVNAAKESETEAPLLWATMKKEFESGCPICPATKKLLSLKACPDVEHERLRPLEWAASVDNNLIVAMLLDHEADIEQARASDGRRPLAIAALAGYEGIVELLINTKAAVNGTNTADAHGALRDAAAGGHLAVCKRLLNAKALVDFGNSEGFHPLHTASSSGHLDVVELLLERKADIDSKKNVSEMTPLHVAAAAGKPEICACLLQRGSQAISMRCQMEGRTPLNLAERAADFGLECHCRTVEILRKFAERHGRSSQERSGIAQANQLHPSLSFNAT